MNTTDSLKAAMQTYEQRNDVYADNFVRLGNVMAAMFPGGLTMQTPKDWQRLYTFMMIQVKQTRYAAQWYNGGHQDSSIDTIVYAALQKEIDDRSTA
jgi:hypothetical protein